MDAMVRRAGWAAALALALAAGGAAAQESGEALPGEGGEIVLGEVGGPGGGADWEPVEGDPGADDWELVEDGGQDWDVAEGEDGGEGIWPDDEAPTRDDRWEPRDGDEVTVVVTEGDRSEPPLTAGEDLAESGGAGAPRGAGDSGGEGSVLRLADPDERRVLTRGSQIQSAPSPRRQGCDSGDFRGGMACGAGS